jgi:hypothetical protein
MRLAKSSAGIVVAAVVSIGGVGCATLGSLARIIAPPQFEQAPGERAEVQLLPPGSAGRLGGASVRIWTRITNPNPFGIRLSTLDGDLYLEGVRAANASFPLGLTLNARGDSVVPLDLRIDFSEVSALGGALRRALAGEAIPFRLDGTVSVDAGPLGQPSFGPSTWLRGDLDTRGLISRPSRSGM